eukprot:2051329-Rhodomonas_salina.2
MKGGDGAHAEGEGTWLAPVQATCLVMKGGDGAHAEGEGTWCKPRASCVQRRAQRVQAMRSMRSNVVRGVLQSSVCVWVWV